MLCRTYFGFTFTFKHNEDILRAVNAAREAGDVLCVKKSKHLVAFGTTFLVLKYH